MKDIFSWSRFKHLAVKYYTERARRRIYSIGLLFIMLIVFFMYGYYIDTNKPHEIIIAFFTGAFFAVIVSNIFLEFKTYNRKQNQILAFTQPQSTLEKYLLIWIDTALVMPLILLAIFFTTNFILLKSTGWGFRIADFNFSALFKTFLGAFCIHSYSLMIASSFRGGTFKTFMYFLGIAIALIFYFGILSHTILKIFGDQDMYSTYTYHFRGVILQLYTRFFNVVLLPLTVSSVIISWIVGYFNLKEYELK